MKKNDINNMAKRGIRYALYILLFGLIIGLTVGFAIWG